MKLILVSFLLICIGILAIPHIIYIIGKCIDWAFHMHKTHYRPYGIAAIVMFMIWLILFVWGHNYGRYFHEIKSVDIECEGLPASFDGYRIVHISDLHLDGWLGHEAQLDEIVSEINDLKPDIIVFTGDLVSLGKKELMPLVPQLRKLKAKDGVLSIMGNHDYLPYDQSMSDRQRAKEIAMLQDSECNDLGWNLLLNENTLVRRGEDSLAFVGCENQSMGVHRVVCRGDLTKALKGTEGMTSIVLTHDPTHWRGEVLDKKWAKKGYNIPLTLSGHTHSGQFRVLGFSVARFVYKEYDGLYTEGNQHLYVNIGLGGTMPMRIGATPEVTLITLRK